MNVKNEWKIQWINKQANKRGEGILAVHLILYAYLWKSEASLVENFKSLLQN